MKLLRSRTQRAAIHAKIDTRTIVGGIAAVHAHKERRTQKTDRVSRNYQRDESQTRRRALIK